MKLALHFISIAFAILVPAQAGVRSAEDIAKGLAAGEGVRGGKTEKRTQTFSKEAYRKLNPLFDPESRGIVIVQNGSQQQATVTVNPAASISFENIRFKIDSIELADEESARQLVEIAKALKDTDAGKRSYIIEGHTCSVGTDAHNQTLSEKRSLAVGIFLRQQGVNCELVPFGYGEQEPVQSNETERGRSTNRRVVVKVKA